MSYRPGSPYLVGAALPGQVQTNAMAAARFRASLAAGGNMLVMGQQPMVSIASPYPQLQGAMSQPMMHYAAASQQRSQIPMASAIPGQSGVLGQNLILNGAQGIPGTNLYNGAVMMNQMQLLGHQPKVLYRPVSHGQQVLSPQVLQEYRWPPEARGSEMYISAGGIRYLAPSSIPQHLAYGSQPLVSPVTVTTSVKNNLDIIKEMKKQDEEKEAEAGTSGESNHSNNASASNMELDTSVVKAPEVKVTQYSSPAKIVTNCQVDLLTQKAAATAPAKVNGILKVKGKNCCCICGHSGFMSLSKSKCLPRGSTRSAMFDSLKKHRCGTCGKGFVKNYSLLLHQRVHHRAESVNVPCDSCSKVLPSPRSLRSHKRVIHTATPATKSDGDEVLMEAASASMSEGAEKASSEKLPRKSSQKCPLCARVCRSRRHLRVHLLSHKRRHYKICAACLKHVRKTMNNGSFSK